MSTQHNKSSVTEMMTYNPLEQQEQLSNAKVRQDCELHSSSQVSTESSSCSSSTRVGMAGKVIPTGSSSLCRQDSASLSSQEDECEMQKEFIILNAQKHPPRQKKRVSFSSIDIREYSRCLQIHPDTTQGPPIGIDWLYQKMGTFNLDEFEANRRKASRRRYDRQREKGNKAFLIPPKVREALLIETGTTKADMRAAVREVQTCQQQRRESKEAQGSEDWLLIKEACKRRYRRWKSGVSKKREQELLWERAAARISQITNSQAISSAS